MTEGGGLWSRIEKGHLEKKKQVDPRSRTGFHTVPIVPRNTNRWLDTGVKSIVRLAKKGKKNKNGDQNRGGRDRSLDYLRIERIEVGSGGR